MRLRTFTGSGIGPAIIDAVEAIADDVEIVTFKAGENMPITAGLAPKEDGGSAIPEYAWDGERWNEIGYL